MWKAHKLWPWQWLTNGVVYIENITAIELMDKWFVDAQRMREKRTPQPKPQLENNKINLSELERELGDQ